MAISKFTYSSNANDFNINAQSTYCSVTLNQEYAAGSYTITTTASNFDIYLYNSDGSNVGYTNIKSVTASRGFNKLVLLGMNTGDVVGFAYKTTFAAAAETTEVTAGPVALSTTPVSMPNAGSTTVLTGLNLAPDVTVTFTGTDNVVRNAKTVVRSSATSLTITRPDTMPTQYSPYAITLTNPGVTSPTGSNRHILTSAVTAGVNPVWVTNTTLNRGLPGTVYTQTLSATDADAGSNITYSAVSGSLPSGLIFSNGTISGTPNNGTIGSYTVTYRATDSGGNYTDKTFTLNVVDYTAMTWQTNITTGSPTITISGNGTNTLSSYRSGGSLGPWSSMSSSTTPYSGPFTMEMRKYGPTTDNQTAYAMCGITPSSGISNQRSNSGTQYSYSANWYPVATNGGLSWYEYTDYTGGATNGAPSDAQGANYTSGDIFRISVTSTGAITYWHGSNTTAARTVSKSDTSWYPNVTHYSSDATNGGFFAIRLLEGFVWNATTQSYVQGT
jgi:hypothetical protein